MRKYIILTAMFFIIIGCASSDIVSIAQAATSKNPSHAFEILAKNKAVYYAKHPNQLPKDLKFLSNFIKNISSNWGKDNVELPKKKEYVKYMQNYKSRALVDFDKGLIYVQTLDNKNPKESLKNAIVTTLLLPNDPSGADLFGAKKIKFGKTPYLYKEVKDDQGKYIRYEWRAKRYANILVKKTKTKILRDGKKVHYVTIPMLKDHQNIRAKRYKPLVEKYAKEFHISKTLIYAIIRTESNFNQFAISNAGAYGLMQVVPKTAGIDAYSYVNGVKKMPSKEYLFDASNNIKLGTAYLKILNTRYLKGIKNDISREYCTISAYNTGSGNVLRTFSKNRNKAKKIINSKTPLQVYDILTTKMPYEEPRRYLQKVVKYKKDFIRM